jgi:hypothetical protein
MEMDFKEIMWEGVNLICIAVIVGTAMNIRVPVRWGYL